MVALTMMALMERLGLAEAGGIEPAQFLDVIVGGGARNGVAAAKRGKILSGHYAPDFSMNRMLKDLKLAEELALPQPGLGLVKDLY